MKVFFLVNAQSRIVNKVVQNITDAKNDFPELLIDHHLTTSAGDGFRAAHEAAHKYDAFIACGGDGSFNEMINGLHFAKAKNDTVVGLLAAGSANDYVKSTGEKSVTELLQTLIKGEQRPIDVGRLEYSGTTRLFANAATNGIGGLVFRKVETGRRSMLPRLNYMSAILRCVLFFKRPRIKLTIDEKVFELDMTMVAIGKGNYIGFGLGFTPQAKTDDGQFGVTILRHSSYYQLFTKYLKLSQNKFIKHPWISYHSGRNITIEVLEGRLPIETDGEYFDIFDKGDKLSYTVNSSQFKLL